MSEGRPIYDSEGHIDPELNTQVDAAIRRFPNTAADWWVGGAAAIRVVAEWLGIEPVTTGATTTQRRYVYCANGLHSIPEGATCPSCAGATTTQTSDERPANELIGGPGRPTEPTPIPKWRVPAGASTEEPAPTEEPHFSRRCACPSCSNVTITDCTIDDGGAGAVPEPTEEQ